MRPNSAWGFARAREVHPKGILTRRVNIPKKNYFWTRRVGSEADMCTRRVHPTRRVVFTSRGAKRRVRCEKKNSRTCTRRVHRCGERAHARCHPKGENSRTRPAHVHGADSAHTHRKITARSDLRVHVIVSKSSCTPRVCACARFMRAHRRCVRYVCTGTLRVLCTHACTEGACVPHRRCGVTSRGAKRRVRHEKRKHEAKTLRHEDAPEGCIRTIHAPEGCMYPHPKGAV